MSNIANILTDLENSHASAAKRKQAYAELLTMLKQEDDSGTIAVINREFWRFFRVFMRDIEDEQFIKNGLTCMGYCAHHESIFTTFSRLYLFTYDERISHLQQQQPQKHK